MNATLLCTSLVARTSAELARLVSQPHPEADVVEARLDYLDQIDLSLILQNRPLPVIATIRTREDRGDWKGTEPERLEILQQACQFGAEYVDVEWDRLEHFGDPGNSKLIGSYHDFEGTPATLEGIVRSLETSQADIVKVATFCRTLADHLRLIEILRHAKKPTIAVSMGPHGHLTRMLAPRYGAYLVFACLGDGTKAAPGQVPIGELVNSFRFRSIGPNTRVCAVRSNKPEAWTVATLLNQELSKANSDVVAVPVPETTNEDWNEAVRRFPFDDAFEIDLSGERDPAELSQHIADWVSRLRR